MIYLFCCEECKKNFEIEFSMKDDEGRRNAKCPICGTKLQRIYSSPNFTIKKDIVIGTKSKNSFVDTKGNLVDFGFANHGSMSGVSKRSIGKKMSGVRVDEKTGRLVVDVVSNCKDPLGTLEKTKTENIKKSIKQKVRIR